MVIVITSRSEGIRLLQLRSTFLAETTSTVLMNSSVGSEGRESGGHFAGGRVLRDHNKTAISVKRVAIATET